MTVTLTQAATTYLDDIAASTSRAYVEKQGADLLVTNIGMTVDEAQAVTEAWLKKHEEKKEHDGN